MPINFIPNDPLAINSLPMRKQTARPNRPASRAGFRYPSAVKKQDAYNVGTPEFLFWQCREAALLALETWEALHGNHTKWARATPNAKLIDLVQNGGRDLNAYYDGQSVSFFEFPGTAKTTYSGASTDVVSHEVGHGLLDSIRPDIWDSKLIEVNSFHEAFGDCMALMTALSDKETRKAVAASLDKANFVETLSEDLSDGVAKEPRLGPTHPAGAPRHALNDFKWQLPTTLPTWGPPDVMIGEEHSFGRIFLGCFYDLIRNIFKSYPNATEQTLWTAVQAAGKIMIAGAEKAPEIPRFFQSVGRNMVLADQNMNGGANRDAIRAAFERHGVALGSAALLAPKAALAGAAPDTGKRAGATLATATRADIRRRIGASAGSRLSIIPKTIGGEDVVEAVSRREVSLGGLDKRLKGVTAIASESVLVGSSGKRAAILSSLPDANTTIDEVQAYVKTLLDNDMIEFDGQTRGGSTKRAAGAVKRGAIAGPGEQREELSAFKTHTIRARAGRKVLERVRFACFHRH
jgi:hypothetical protein